MDTTNNNDKARELYNIVDSWVDRTFNFIQLEVYEKIHDGMLIEHIRQTPVSELVEEYKNNLDPHRLDEIKEEIKDLYNYTPRSMEVEEEEITDYLCEHYEDEVRDWNQENGYDENYPMWNILFEFRSEPPSHWVYAAQEAGLGVINNGDFFNTTLFAMSAGHSFHASYWIPLYLKIFEADAKHYKGVDYSMM